MSRRLGGFTLWYLIEDNCSSVRCQHMQACRRHRDVQCGSCLEAFKWTLSALGCLKGWCTGNGRTPRLQVVGILEILCGARLSTDVNSGDVPI